MKPRGAGPQGGRPRPGLPAVQQISREEQEPRMKHEHRHDTKVACLSVAFKPVGQAAT